MRIGIGRTRWLVGALVPFLAMAEHTNAPEPQKVQPVTAVTAIFGFRGDGSGVFAKAKPPVVWGGDAGTNILWKTQVGKSQSSPAIGGGRIFVTAETEQLCCLDRSTGKVLWKKDNGFSSLPPEMKVVETRLPADGGCGYSTPTPVTDGKHIWASYGTGIVVCYDLEGNRQWVRFFDQPSTSEYGRSASPLLTGGKLLVTIGYLLALDPVTGKTLWECPDAVASFGTPVATRIASDEVVFTPKGDCIRLVDGKVLGSDWGNTAYSSPVVAQGTIFFGMPVQALRLPDKVDTAMRPKTLWEASDPTGDSFASPVLFDGIFYTVGNDGVLWAFDAVTGKLCYQQDLPIPNSSGKTGSSANIYASLVVAGGNLIIVNDAGQAVVIATGRVYKELAHNILDEGSGSTPVADGAQLFLRSGEMLYCIGS